MPQELSYTVDGEHVKKCLKHVPKYMKETGAVAWEPEITHEIKDGVIHMRVSSILFLYE
jgi:hypothetical protein